jgi:hypothetical protein
VLAETRSSVVQWEQDSIRIYLKVRGDKVSALLLFLLKNFVVIFARLDKGFAEEDDDEDVEVGEAGLLLKFSFMFFLIAASIIADVVVVDVR